jgi:hypothetical protein
MMISLLFSSLSGNGRLGLEHFVGIIWASNTVKNNRKGAYRRTGPYSESYLFFDIVM